MRKTDSEFKNLKIKQKVPKAKGRKIKAIEQYFSAVLFGMLCKGLLRTFEFVGTILNCDHSNLIFPVMLFHHYAVS